MIVVGGGPGGYVAAIRAAQLGAKVALVHNDDLGGTCLNRGCIPSKALIHCAAAIQDAKNARAVGISFSEPKTDFDKVRAHASRTVKQLVGGIKGLLKANGVASVGGRGRLTGRNEVTVQKNGETLGVLTAPTIIWATGSLPTVLPIRGSQGKHIITSDDAVSLPGPPDEMVIVGGGAIGVEFAYIYSQFGTTVHLFELMDRLVPTEDPDVSEVLTAELKKAGCRIYTGCRCTATSDVEGRKRVECEINGTPEEMDVDIVMMAVGRYANTEDMGLDEAGVAMDRGRIQVDEIMRTNVDGLYAIGDCTRGTGLAHQASCEGICAVEVALGERDGPCDQVIPAATYTHPEIGSVGIREHEARQQGLDVSVGTFPFSALGKASATRHRTGFIKVISDAATGSVIGGSIVGPSASDLLGVLTVAIQNNLSAADVANVCFAHPTLCEGIGEAAHGALGHAIHLPPG
jgi:dihydrolipoamide dehydrogenase